MKVAANLERQLSGVLETAERNAKARVGNGSSPMAGPFFVGAKQKLPRKMMTGSGAPSLCWHCLKQLQRAPGRGLGLFYFHLVIGADGNRHRVHGDCLRPALDDGAKLIQE